MAVAGNGGDLPGVGAARPGRPSRGPLRRVVLPVAGAALALSLVFDGWRPAFAPRGPDGCFGGQPRTPAERRVAENVVQIWWGAPGRGGQPIASGAVLEGGGGFVLTALHAAPPWASGHLRAVDLRGADLGPLRVVAHGTPHPVPGSGGALLGDLSLLAPAGGDDAGGALRAMPGLPLAPGRPPGALLVRFDGPAGPDVGTSGAPVTDSHGRVLGILTHSASPGWPRAVLLGFGPFATRRGVPRRGWGFADALDNARAAPVLAAARLPPPAGAPARWPEASAMASHPWGNCVLHRVRVAPFGGDMPSETAALLAFRLPREAAAAGGRP